MMIIGIVEDLTLSKSEKYGDSSWITLSGISIKANIHPDELPAVGELVAMRLERRGKLLLAREWSFVDLAGKPLDLGQLEFDWHSIGSTRSHYAGGITRKGGEK